MEKVGSPKGLIRYDTLNGMENGWSRAQVWRRVFRPRVLVYSVVLLTVTGVLFAHIATRQPVKVDVMRDRGALSREVKNGVIENVYRVMLINSAEFDRTFNLSVEGLPTLSIDSERSVAVAAASNRMVAVRVRAEPDAGNAGSNPIELVVQAADDPSVFARTRASFFLPDLFQ
jgi:polyferredoxin